MTEQILQFDLATVKFRLTPEHAALVAKAIVTAMTETEPTEDVAAQWLVLAQLFEAGAGACLLAGNMPFNGWDGVQADLDDCGLTTLIPVANRGAK
jgi:hypothetical protein